MLSASLYITNQVIIIFYFLMKRLIHASTEIKTHLYCATLRGLVIIIASLQLLAKFSAQRPSATRSYSFSRSTIEKKNTKTQHNEETRSIWRWMLIKSGICFHPFGRLHWGKITKSDSRVSSVHSKSNLYNFGNENDESNCVHSSVFYSFRRSFASRACFSFRERSISVRAAFYHFLVLINF